ncbi:collagen alpha-4(VI) chain-like isoform X2 [Mixophyes fleayi]|uniref:collagen alpha-4(VI) chain-like isoform X2 n=1 Tax=Mixophyes fleayi TaxID=3061075 RepID=UPI003F4D72B3
MMGRIRYFKKMGVWRTFIFFLILGYTIHDAHSQKTVCTEASIADIVFMVDGSWSIGTENFEVMRNFLYTLINGFDVSQDNIRIGLIQYSDDPRTEFYLNTYSRKEDVLRYIETLKYKGGSTKTGQSLQFMLENHFTERAGGRAQDGVPQIAVVITDGQSQDNIGEPAKKVKNAGITLYAIGIKDALLTELNEIASDPDEKHVYNVADFAALQDISQNMLQVLCTTVEEAIRQIGQSVSVCRNANQADIVFLVESSTRIGEVAFQKVKDFVYGLVSSLDVDINRVRIGLAQYSDETNTIFLLNDYSLKSEILEKIQSLLYTRGNAYTGRALKVIDSNFFTESAGSRAAESIAQILVVVTNGRSADEVTKPARGLKSRGISIYVTGPNIKDIAELQEMANKPSKKFIHHLDTLDAPNDVTKSLLNNICSSIVTNIQAFSRRYADVVFLVDSSSSIGSLDFQQIKLFISSIIGQLDIGINKYQVGLALYSESPHTEFLLNRYETKQQALDHVEKIAFRGGRLNTGSALDYLRRTFFVEEAGSRINQGIPQFAVVITSAKSEDVVISYAEELRSVGVTTISVGIRNSVREELVKIATDPFVFQLNDLKDRRNVQEDVVNVIVTEEMLQFAEETIVPAVCSSASVADIVFLVDESSSIGNTNFQLTRVFLHKVINALEIGLNNVRVGLVLYSDMPRLEFKLNTFKEKYEILDYITKLPYRGGKPNTGAAIDFLQKELFSKQNGGRGDLGVKQIAMVMTNGQSVDDFAKPAAKLRRSGVEVFAVGFQNANIPELETIASHPRRKHVTNVESFLQLPNIELRLKKHLCNEIVATSFAAPSIVQTVRQGCVDTGEADIFFLVDGSGSISPENFGDMKNFMSEFVSMFQLGVNKVRFGVVQYSDSPRVEFTISRYTNQNSLKGAIQQIYQLGGGTLTGEALMSMKSLFADAKGERSPNVPQFLIVITDGESQDRVTEAAADIRGDGITIYAIGIKNAVEEQLEDIAGSKDKMFFVNNFDSLNLIKLDLARDLCTPAACKNISADIIFLIDSSETIKSGEYEKMKTFMNSIVKLTETGPERVQFGLIQFSTRTKEEFPLNRFAKKDEIQTAILGINQMNEGTLTGAALKYTLPYFSASKGGRPNTKQYLIIITDGESKDAVAQPAAAIRNMGVIIYAIGVLEANNTQLVEITGQQDRVFFEDNFEALSFLDNQIIFEICNPGKYCNLDITVSVDYSRRIRPSTTSILQQKLNLFLPQVLQHMSTLSNISCASGSQINIQFRYAAPRPDGSFYFDSEFEKYNEEVLKKYIKVQSTVDTYLNPKFLESLWTKFTNLPAQRAKVIIVFTDGMDDTLQALKMTSESLRLQGLDGLLLIGLEGVQNLKELQEIEFGRGFSFQQPLSISIYDLPSVMLREIDTVVERKCCNVICKCIGPDGSRGAQGFPGVKGRIGAKGAQGHPGEEGGIGERGPHGLNGTQGEDGCPGPRGLKGGRGFRGDRGEDGDNGIDGVPGEQGERGAPGATGETGSIGPQGNKGPRGESGEKGEPGLRGDPGDLGINNDILGPKGLKGNPGRQGEPGNDGDEGEPGDNGLEGPQGRRGSPGLKGERGVVGEPGNPGEGGIQGIQGPRGLSGVPGLQGQQGLPGPQGTPGGIGAPGVLGNPGSRGAKGEPGDSGEKGDTGIPGHRGPPGIDGADGYGSPGMKGQKGHIGFPGYPGPQGEDGEPGKPGDVGPKGVRGRRANPGLTGEKGGPGDIGPPGSRGPKGPQGAVSFTTCELVNFTRENCPCFSGPSKCPVYPSEIVFALDTSQAVSTAAFQRMKDIITSLVKQMEISDSNCPKGARVAVVSYSNNVKHLIRFPDYKKENLLLEAIRNIPLERTTSGRNIGEAMRYVARNIFKRVRHGVLMRNIAIFFANGPSQDDTSINTAVLELRALKIIPAVIAFSDVPNVEKAFAVDESRVFQLFVWKRPEDQNLKAISHCTLCYDKCQPDEECELDPVPPTDIAMDIVFILDSSRSVRSDDFVRAKAFVSTMLDHIHISEQPQALDTGARVALLQQATPGFMPNRNVSPVKTEFDLVSYNDRNLMKRHIQEAVSQLEGPSALGYSVQWAIENIFKKSPNARKHKVIFTILGSRTSSWDREKLKEVSRIAKCEKFTLFVLAFGKDIRHNELLELSSLPQSQHALHVLTVSKPEMVYAERFIHAFMSLLNDDVNDYPAQAFQAECEKRGDSLLSLSESVSYTELEVEPTDKTLEYVEREVEEYIYEEETEGNSELVTSEDAVDEKAEPEIIRPVAGKCLLDVNHGTTCGDFQRMWYYIKDVDACSQFWYGGCDGNGNKFITENECLQTCSPNRQGSNGGSQVLSKDICTLKQEEGDCQDYILKWWYNSDQNECDQFWYGGCGGNKNQFETQEQCEAACLLPS